MPVAAAKEIVARDHPKAFSHGTIKTAGEARSPAAASRHRNTIATTKIAYGRFDDRGIRSEEDMGGR
jgi:hypothetical protein